MTTGTKGQRKEERLRMEKDLNILIVDDDKNNLYSYKTILKKLNCKIIAADSGEKA